MIAGKSAIANLNQTNADTMRLNNLHKKNQQIREKNRVSKNQNTSPDNTIINTSPDNTIFNQIMQEIQLLQKFYNDKNEHITLSTIDISQKLSEVNRSINRLQMELRDNDTDKENIKIALNNQVETIINLLGLNIEEISVIKNITNYNEQLKQLVEYYRKKNKVYNQAQTFDRNLYTDVQDAKNVNITDLLNVIQSLTVKYNLSETKEQQHKNELDDLRNILLELKLVADDTEKNVPKLTNQDGGDGHEDIIRIKNSFEQMKELYTTAIGTRDSMINFISHIADSIGSPIAAEKDSTGRTITMQDQIKNVMTNMNKKLTINQQKYTIQKLIEKTNELLKTATDTSEIDELKNVNTTLEKELDACGQKSERRKEERDIANETIKQLDQNIKQLTSDLERIRSQRNELKDTNAVIGDIESEKNKLGKIIVNYTKLLWEYIPINDGFTDDDEENFTIIKNKLKNYKNDYDNYNIHNKLDDVKEHTFTIKNTFASLERYMNEKQNLEKKLSRSSKTINELETRIEKLNTDLIRIRKERKELKTNNVDDSSELNEEIDTLHNLIEDLIDILWQLIPIDDDKTNIYEDNVEIIRTNISNYKNDFEDRIDSEFSISSMFNRLLSYMDEIEQLPKKTKDKKQINNKKLYLKVSENVLYPGKKMLTYHLQFDSTDDAIKILHTGMHINECALYGDVHDMYRWRVKYDNCENELKYAIQSEIAREYLKKVEKGIYLTDSESKELMEKVGYGKKINGGGSSIAEYTHKLYKENKMLGGTAGLTANLFSDYLGGKKSIKRVKKAKKNPIIDTTHSDDHRVNITGAIEAVKLKKFVKVKKSSKNPINDEKTHKDNIVDVVKKPKKLVRVKKLKNPIEKDKSDDEISEEFDAIITDDDEEASQKIENDEELPSKNKKSKPKKIEKDIDESSDDETVTKNKNSKNTEEDIDEPTDDENTDDEDGFTGGMMM